MIVIFDVDGVLIDVTKSYHNSIKDTVDYFSEKDSKLEELLDIKFSFNINNDWDASLAGIIYSSMDTNLEKFKDMFVNFSTRLEDMYSFAEELSLEVPNYEDLIEFFEEKYKFHREKESLIFPHDLLKKIREKSVIMGVITGRPFEDLDYSFKEFDLYKYFDYIITEDDIPAPDLRKPSSYPLKKFFEKYKYIEPVYYIGDTKSDLSMVENYNEEEGKDVQFVLNETPHNSDIEADLRISKPEEFLDILDNKKEFKI